MRRREFIAILGGAAVMPLSARAQPRLLTVGFLSSLGKSDTAHLLAGFHRGLSEAGFVAGRNLAIEYRWAEGLYDRLPALAADLVGRQVDVIVSTGGHPTLLAARAATTTIPIVFASGIDAVKTGIVASLNRPGGNITGVQVLTVELEAKRLGLLNDILAPSAAIAVLINPNNPTSRDQIEVIQEAARAARRSVHVVSVVGDSDLEASFAKIASLKPGGLLVASDPALSTMREPLVALSARYELPTIYQWRSFAEQGGLMSYGTDLPDAYRLVGVYAGRVLKGENPASIPIEQSIKFELVINLKTAKAMNVAFPPGILAIADVVIE